MIYGSIYSCLQFFNSIRWHVFWHCAFSFCEGFIVNGVINIIIVTLEKRYELTSQKSGMIASANDFGAAALLILVGYLGTYANKPRLMAAGMFLMSLGCLVFSLPQFIGDEYTYSISSEYDPQFSVCFDCITKKQEIKYYLHNVYIYVRYAFIQPNIEKEDYTYEQR